MASVITNETVYSDLKTLIPLLLTEYIYQYSGADHYTIRYQDRDECPPAGGKPVIFWNSLTITPFKALSHSEYIQQVSFNLGAKYDSENKSHLGFSDQTATLVDMFSPFNASNRRYSFTFKTATYTNATLADIGIFNPYPGGSVEFRDKECKCYTFEMPITFELRYTITFDHDLTYSS